MWGGGGGRARRQHFAHPIDKICTEIFVREISTGETTCTAEGEF
jgi:hypothetical protein